MKIRYIGSGTNPASYQEYPVTGVNALWQPEQVSDVSATRANSLMATGLFAADDDDVSIEGQIKVSASSSAEKISENTAILSGALRGGGLVEILTPGTIYINDTLWIDDGCRLVTGPKTWLKLAPGTNKKLIAYRPEAESWAAVSVSWTAGNQATVTWTAHGRSAGDALVLQGANEPDWNDVYRVMSVTDANTLVIGLREFVTAGPTGTITAKRCVRNTNVVANLDYDYANNPSAPASTDRHCMSGAFVADSEINVRVRNGYKYGLLVCGALNVSGSVGSEGVSDILKIYGPSSDVSMQVSGVSFDDCLSLQAKEPPAFVAYMPAWGPVRNCAVRDVDTYGSSGTSSGGIVVYGDPDNELDNILVSGGSVNSRTRAGMAIKYGTGFSSGKIKKVTVEDIRLAPLATNYCFSVSANVDVLMLRRIVFLPDDDVTQLFRQESTSTIRLLIVEGVEFDESLWPSASTAAYAFNLNGIVNTVVFRNCSMRGRSSQARFLTVGTNGVRNIVFDGCDFENLSQLMIQNNAAVAPRISLINGTRLKSVTTGIDARGPCTVILDSSEFDTITNGVVRPNTNAITVEVHERACTFTGASAITCVAPGQAVPKSLTLPVDIGATGIIKSAGGLAYNTGAGRGTVAQNRAVTCNGTNWVQVDTPANVF